MYIIHIIQQLCEAAIITPNVVDEESEAQRSEATTLARRAQEVDEQMFKPTLMTPKPMPSPFLYGSLESHMAQTAIEEDPNSQLPPNSFVTLKKLLGFSMPELPNL